MNSLQPNSRILDPVVNYQTVAYNNTGSEYKVTQVTHLSVWAVRDRLSPSLRYRNIEVLLFPVTSRKEESHSVEIKGNEDLLATALSAEEAKKEIFSQLIDLLDKNNEGYVNLHTKNEPAAYPELHKKNEPVPNDYVELLKKIESLGPLYSMESKKIEIESKKIPPLYPIESLSPIKKDKDLLRYIIEHGQTISIKTFLNDKSSS